MVYPLELKLNVDSFSHPWRRSKLKFRLEICHKYVCVLIHFECTKSSNPWKSFREQKLISMCEQKRFEFAFWCIYFGQTALCLKFKHDKRPVSKLKGGNVEIHLVFWWDFPFIFTLSTVSHSSNRHFSNLTFCVSVRL